MVSYGGRKRTYRTTGLILRRGKNSAQLFGRRVKSGLGAMAYGASKFGGKNRSNTTNSTKTRKIKLNQKATPEGTGGFKSNCYYKPRRMPLAYSRVIRAIPKNYYVINGSQRVTQGPGLQVVANLLNVFNKTDVSAISNKISSTTINVNRFLLKGASSEILMTNQDAGNVRVWLYDIVARRDLSTSSTIADPKSAWSLSLADEGGSNANYQIPGNLPFSSDLFTQFFKIVKITNVILAQGQSHTHKVSMVSNKVIDGEYIQYEGNGFKGLTHFTMLVAHGMPYNDSTTKTQVSTGNVAIDVVNKIQYEYTWLQDVTTTYSAVNSLPTAFTVSEDIMDIGTGAIAVDTTA